MNNKKRIFYDYAFMTVGCMILGLAINMFFVPINLVTGGVSGVAIIILSLTGLPIWIMNLALNVPLFLIGFKVLGFKFVKRTMYCTLVLTFALYITQNVPPYEGDLFLVSTFGGMIMGLGLGLVFRGGATTGGSDLLASIINKRFKHVPVANIMLVVDSLIVTAGAFMFGATKAMYAIVAVFVCSKVINAIVDGFNSAKAIYIISEQSHQIAQSIMLHVQRGVTALKGVGVYSGKQKDVLLCVISQKQITKLKEVVKEVDGKAFLLVYDVKEVLGEGFQDF